jgi:hypothetical protein
VVRLYGTVEYFGVVFQDAELIRQVWHYEGIGGNLLPFVSQHYVHVLDGPHPEHWNTRMRRRSQTDT